MKNRIFILGIFFFFLLPALSRALPNPKEILHYELNAETHLLHVLIEETLYEAVLGWNLSAPEGLKDTQKKFIEGELALISEKKNKTIDELARRCASDPNYRETNFRLLTELIQDDYFHPIADWLSGLYGRLSGRDAGLALRSVHVDRNMINRPCFTFYHDLLKNRLRLIDLFPRVTSEIAKIRPDEVLGYSITNGEILLTFDDGPTNYTPELLDVLEANEVKGAFFVIGKNIKKPQHDLLVRLVNSGHTLGHHSFNHLDLAKRDLKKNQEELGSATRLLEELTGKKAVFFRAPYGSRSQDTLRAMDELGQKHILWNIDSMDWRLNIPDPEVAERVLRQAILYNGGIVLMHESVARTRTLLAYLLPGLKKEGFVFVSGDQRLLFDK